MLAKRDKGIHTLIFGQNVLGKGDASNDASKILKIKSEENASKKSEAIGPKHNDRTRWIRETQAFLGSQPELRYVQNATRRKNRNSHKSIWHIEIKSCITARLYSYHSAQINRFSGSMQIHRIIGMCVCMFFLLLFSYREQQNSTISSFPFSHYNINIERKKNIYIYYL